MIAGDGRIVGGPSITTLFCLRGYSKSALDAVKKWEYKPYLLNGQPVEVETTENVTFSLGR